MPDIPSPSDRKFAWFGVSVVTVILVLIFNAIVFVATVGSAGWGGSQSTAQLIIFNVGKVLLLPYFAMRWLVSLIPWMAYHCEAIGFILAVLLESAVAVFGILGFQRKIWTRFVLTSNPNESLDQN